MTEIAPWIIDTTQGVIYADYLEGQLFNQDPGADIEPSFVFVSWGIDEAPRDRHESLQEFVDAAKDGTTVRTGLTNSGRPYYREELADWSVDSLLVRLTPRHSQTASNPRGSVWGVLKSGTDTTPPTETDVFAWSLELTVLQRDDGTPRSEVEATYLDEVH